jgi:hypothetical protein
MQMHLFGYYLVLTVPSVLFVMNLVWFSKILKGVKKTLLKWSRSTRLHGQELSTELGVPAVLRCDLEL